MNIPSTREKLLTAHVDHFAFSSLIVQIAAVFMHVEHPTDLSRLDRIAAYYLMAMTFYAVIWTARLSILFSIIRIDPDPVWRRRLMWLAGAFIAALCFFYAQLLWTCETMTNGWKNKVSPQCPLPKQIAICQLVCMCMHAYFCFPTAHSISRPNSGCYRRSDPHSVAHSAHPRYQGQRPSLASLLHLFHLEYVALIPLSHLRTRVFTSISAVVTTVVSLVHAAYIITTGGIPVVIAALVEDCMSLTVANLPVVATASLLRISGVSSRDEDDGQRWSSFKFRTRTQQPGATTHLTSGFGGISRGVGLHMPTDTEVSGTTTFEPTKSTIPVVSEDLFAATPTKLEMDGDAEKGQSFDPQMRQGDGTDVVRIDMLPYPSEPPPPES